MIETTINGITFTSLGLGLIRRDIPVLPDTRDYTVQIAGGNGEVDFGADYGPRIINHECVLMADDSTLDYQAKVAALATIFDARKGDVTLTYSDRPNRNYKARYAGTLPIQKIIFDGNITIPMKMYDPFPESDERLLETTITASPDVLSIVSDGDVRADPVITLTNTGSTTINSLTIKNEIQLE
ncbi:MAG: phage tail protein [Bacilli bacterium]|nr:phage tail protein [Bacilli bacterium]